MNIDLDSKLNLFLDRLKQKPSEEWVVGQAEELLDEGIGRDGLLELILSECGQEIHDKYKDDIENVGKLQPANANPISGVAGWLMFLCISLVFLSPGRSIYSMFVSYEQLSSYFGVISGMDKFFYFMLVEMIIFSGFSIYVGLKLWRISINAVKAAKIFLAVQLLANITVPFQLWLLDIEGMFAGTNILPVSYYVNSIIYFIFWFTYLSLSQRVKNTYQPVK